MISIVLADDHKLLCEALRMLLETQPDLEVVAETGDGLEALELTETRRPDVLIVDMMMPGLSGLEVARRSKRLSPSTRVIILSMYDAESYVAESMQAGVAGYVLKKGSAQELVLAIRRAMEGGIYLSPALDQRALQVYIQQSMESRAEDPFNSLTDREREVFQLAAEGMNNPQIAERLSLSPRTVEMHRGNLLKKLGLRSQTDLVKYALKRGLLE